MSAIGPKSVVESGTILGEAAKPPPVCGSPPMTSAVVGWPLEPMADDVATLDLDMLLAARIAPICEGQREHRCNAAGALLHPT